jgi:hypothetical protein
MANDKLDEQTATLAASLKYIADHAHDYDALLAQTGMIVHHLLVITNDPTDLDKLEARLDRILAKLAKCGQVAPPE